MSKDSHTRIVIDADSIGHFIVTGILLNIVFELVMFVVTGEWRTKSPKAPPVVYPPDPTYDRMVEVIYSFSAGVGLVMAVAVATLPLDKHLIIGHTGREWAVMPLIPLTMIFW